MDFSFDGKYIGVLSWKIRVHTKLNCESTDRPSSAATLICGCHSMGTNRDVCIAQEKVIDKYCGWILQGLLDHSSGFAASHPDFVPIDLTKSMGDVVSETELVCRQVEVNKDVDYVLESIFGVENLQANSTVCKLL